MRRLSVLLALVWLAGCVSLPFRDNPALPPPAELGAQQLAAACWPAPQQHYRVRQTVLFELRGAKVPMTGLMDLDTRRGEIRLVALNDLGIKFFDLQLDATTQQLHYLLPELARFPDFDTLVASAVRRIFLAPRPDGSETLQRQAKRSVLRRADEGRDLAFEFGGPEPRLYTIRVRGGDEDWQADYYEYTDAPGPAAPRGVVLDDRKGGYRLTLWLDEVTRREP